MQERQHNAFCTLVAICLSGFVIRAAAHTLPISFLTVVPGEEYLHLELSFNPFELAAYSELDRNHNGRVEPPEWEAQQCHLTGLLTNALLVLVAGKPVPAEVAGLTREFDSHHAMLRAHYRVDARQSSVTIESRLTGITSGSHVTQVTFGKAGREQRARLDAQSRSVEFRPYAGNGVGNTPPTQAPSGTVPRHGVWAGLVVAASGLALGTALLLRGKAFLSRRVPRCYTPSVGENLNAPHENRLL